MQAAVFLYPKWIKFNLLVNTTGFTNILCIKGYKIKTTCFGLKRRKHTVLIEKPCRHKILIKSDMFKRTLYYICLDILVVIVTTHNCYAEETFPYTIRTALRLYSIIQGSEIHTQFLNWSYIATLWDWMISSCTGPSHFTIIQYLILCSSSLITAMCSAHRLWKECNVKYLTENSWLQLCQFGWQVFRIHVVQICIRDSRGEAILH